MIEALRTTLQADPVLMQHVAVYDFGDGVNRPAVFLDEAEDTTTNPCVILTESTGPSDEGTRAQRAVEYKFTIRTRWDRTTSPAMRREHAMMIWKALDRLRLPVDGFEDMRLRAATPSGTVDQDGFPGYVIEGSCIAEEAI